MTGAQAPAAQLALRMWPLLVVVIGLAIAVVADRGWRPGCLVIGLSLLIGAVERLVLPANAAGLLQVRGKAFDTVMLTLAGAAVLVLTLAVPGGR